MLYAVGVGWVRLKGTKEVTYKPRETTPVPGLQKYTSLLILLGVLVLSNASQTPKR